MTWNYRIVRHFSNGEEWFAIHEVYYEGGRIVNWLSDPIMLISDEPLGLKDQIEQLLKAFDKDVLEENDFDMKAVYKE